MYYTFVDIPIYPYKLTYKDKSFWIGSCFTTNIGNAIKQLKFHCEINPFGALFNPMSILSGLNLLLQKKTISSNNLFQANELWNSFLFHSSFSDIEQEKTLSTMNSRIISAGNVLSESKFLFITFGTAYVFKLKSSGEIVGNCHKLPSNEFYRERLTVEEITKEYSAFIQEIVQQCPNIKIVFSVSPIRHLSDGAHNNQLSKSILLMAIDNLINKYSDTCFYFPSYEIVLDELRDYRFYDNDMCHISQLTIDHIKEKFINSMISATDSEIIKEIAKLNSSRLHKPSHTNTQTYKSFIAKIDEREAALKELYPYLCWDS